MASNVAISGRQMPSVPELVRQVRTLKGERLKAMIDAARDVAKASDDTELQMAAAAIMSVAKEAHPELVG